MLSKFDAIPWLYEVHIHIHIPQAAIVSDFEKNDTFADNTNKKSRFFVLPFTVQFWMVWGVEV